jgi:hypothetical protein
VHNFSQYIYFFSLHISGDYMPIIRRNNCIYATLGTCHSVWMTVWYAGWNGTHFNPAYQTFTQSNKYQVSYKHRYFSWWWAHSRPKHVQKRNKHTKKIVHQVGLFTSYFETYQTGCEYGNRHYISVRGRWIL